MLDFRLHAGPPGARACVCVCACAQQRGVVSTGWPWHRSRFQRLPRKWGRNDSANSVLKTDRESDFGELTTTLTKGQSLQKKKKRKKEDVLFIYFYFFVFLSSMRVWKNDPVLDGELVITSGAWRLSHFNTLTALHILETKQIKNAWWSGTYLEFSVVAESARVAGSGEMQLAGGGVFGPDGLISHLMNESHDLACQCFPLNLFRYSREWSKWKVRFTWGPENVIGNDGAFVSELMNTGRNPGLPCRSERGWIKIWLKAN